ncbi:V-set and immunoglobulin domain-containing protein 10 isoform X2 [Carcharodon carcharias]|uniref:V-set and immunoglobulin domain-containing protein 10 isoform X2 n=1 Tax=Carcharodon carcharias TaxID=13397 RepID=UPI001B7DB533|nr:V-set and immunoglobulin domain-containing protein 10 isoform X2 [Carcharodon carcharias]
MLESFSRSSNIFGERNRVSISDDGEKFTIAISPGEELPNNTMYIIKHKNVSFSCSSTSQQKLNISWIFVRPDSNREVFTFVEGNHTEFTLFNIDYDNQGNYTCLKNFSDTKEVLVYYPPQGPPVCHAEFSNNYVQLFCSWTKGYPYPTFAWSSENQDLGPDDHPYGLPGSNDTMILQVKGSEIHDGQMFKCVAYHIAYEQRMEQSCSLTLKAPLPESQPLVAGYIGKNTSLTCHSKEGNPPPILTWWRNDETEIFSSSKYVISQEGVVSSLTILMSSKEQDEGRYICKSENPLGIKEVEIWVSFNTKILSGLVGGITVFLLLSAAAILGVVLHRNWDKLITRRHFWQTGSTVFTLVDSEEENDFVDEDSSRITSVVNHQPAQMMNGHTSGEVASDGPRTTSNQLPNEERNESDV